MSRLKETSQRTKLGLALAILFAPSSLPAQTITVVSGGCELSDAILAANQDIAIGDCVAGSGEDTIELPDNSLLTYTEPYRLDVANGLNALPVITDSLTINGHGSTLERSMVAESQFRLLSAGTRDRPFKAFKLTLNNLTIRNGSLESEPGQNAINLCGGGVFSGEQQVIQLNQSTVTQNRASRGGGICGPVELVDSTVSFNSASSSGGGVYLGFREKISVSGSTVSDNHSNARGGGIFGHVSYISISDSLITRNVAINGAGVSSYLPFSKTFTTYYCNKSVINRTTISNNIAAQDGGGISESCELDLMDSTVSGNKAINGAGIKLHFYGRAQIISSTLSGNIATGDGGGIAGNVHIKNSTISGNSAQRGGGIMWEPSSVDNTTIVNNTAQEGAGIFVSPQPSYRNYGSFSFVPSIRNTVIAKNAGDECFLDQRAESFPSAFDNVVRKIDPNINNWFGDDSCDGIASGDPMLAELSDNGGLTLTHALLFDSPIMNVANTSVCLNSALDQDQRGVQRLNDQLCDIGAYENLSTETPTIPQIPPVVAGSIVVNHVNQAIPFPSTSVFDKQPIVILGPLSFNGSQPAVSRLSKIDKSGFNIKVQEYNYLDGFHVNETVDYFAIQPGSYQFTDSLGSTVLIEAGTFEVNASHWHQQRFETDFSEIPVVFTSVQTYRGLDAVTERVRKLTKSGFEVKLFEEEKLQSGGHLLEKVGYVAFSILQGQANFSVNGTITQFKTKSNASISHRWSNVIADFLLKIEEEQSLDDEIFHVREQVNLLSIENLLFAEDISGGGLDTSSIRKKKP